MVEPPSSRDLLRTVLGVLFIALLIAGSLWVLRPFLPALIWAAMVVVATWPIMLYVQARLWGKRSLAVLVMTTLLLLVLLVPLALAVWAIVAQVDRLAQLPATLATVALPSPPAWLAKLPLVGPKLVAKWQAITTTPPEQLAVSLAPYVEDVFRWFVARLGTLGLTFVQFLLIVVIAAILYAKGESTVAGVRSFMRRLAGDQGDLAIGLAGQAIRGVALGVIVTALVQSIVAGVGLAITGVPNVIILSAVMVLLGIAQVGPIPVMLPAVIWLFWKGNAGWGTVLALWTVVVGLLDNVLRPILIKRGANLPLLLILTGVIGGLLAFGVIGLFIGPVTLAVSYTLLQAWVSEGGRGAAGAAAEPPPPPA